MLTEIVLKILCIFLLTGIGVTGSRFKLILPETGQVLNKFLFNIATPCIVFSTMQRDAMDQSMVHDVGWSFLSYSAITLFIGLLSFPGLRPVKMDENSKGIFRMQLAFTNVGFMGIPLADVILGKESLLLVLIMNIAYVLLIYSFGVFLMIHRKGEALLDKEMLKRMINPPFIASLTGILIFVSGFHFPGFVNDTFDLVSDTMAPLAMIIVGIKLNDSNIHKLMKKENMILCVMSLVITPLITWGVCMILPQSSLVTATLVFMMAMPSGTLCAILAEEFDKDVMLASEGVAATTFFSLFTLPLWAMLIMTFLL